MRAKNLEDVLVYQKAMAAIDPISAVLERPAVRNDFDIWDQLRRSSGSVGPLIAEGFGQLTDRHLASYLGRARGSAHETCAQLDRARRKKYISKAEFNQLSGLYIEIGKMLTPWINYLYRCDWKSRGQPPGEELDGAEDPDQRPPV
jgi:four helix bundle protein